MMIRIAHKEDYEQVEAIMKEVQALHIEWRPDIYRCVETVLDRAYFEEEIENEEVFVAELEGSVVGVMEIKYRHISGPQHVNRTVLFIDTMAVKEGYRGCGIGKAFFELLKEMKREKNLDGIELQVNARNEAAYKMYRKCGFTEKSINMELLE